MRLQEIQIKGFKSFAQSTSLHFQQAITGIVGPNGCGKSNFVDAIRWALGEQRMRLLRTERMHELIFNGTKERKPLQMAEVSLLLEQSRGVLPTAHASLQIRRRIYRSGESEYAINGVPARLRDITALMIDSGLSAEAYSIIELKMIEEILSDKQGTRLQLFEQAAGVAKFKLQRKEALQKLRHTEADLERIKDMLHELGRNLRTLEQQARKAQEHAELWQEYEALRILGVQRRCSVLEEELAACSKKQQEEANQESRVKGKLRRAEAEQQALRKGYEEQEKRLQTTGRSFAEQQRNLQQMEKDLDICAVRQTGLRERMDRYREEIQRQQSKQKEAREHQQGLAKEALRLEAEIQVAVSVAEQAGDEAETAAQRVAEARKRNHQEQSRRQVLDEAWQQAKEQLARLATRSEGLIEKRKLLDEKEGFEKEEAQKQTHRLVQLEKEIEKLSLRFSGLEQRKAAAMERLGELEQLAQSSRDSCQTAAQQLKGLEESHAWLCALRDNMEGFSAVLRWLRLEKKLEAPLLVEALRPCEPYVSALSAYLTPYAEHFILSTREEAAQVFAWLREENIAGYCHCFVLEELPTCSSHAPLPKEAVSACEHVDCIEMHAPLRDYLLRDVAILPAAQGARPQDGLRAVLADDGSWGCAQALLWGGEKGEDDKQQSWGLARRMDEIEASIEEKQQRLRMEQQGLAAREGELKKFSDAGKQEALDEQLTALKRSLDALKEEQVALNALLSSRQQHLGEHGQQMAEIEKAHTEITAKEQALSEKIQTLEKERHALLQASKAIRVAFDEIQDKAHRLQEARHQAILALNKKKAEAERLAGEQRLHNGYLVQREQECEQQEHAHKQAEAELRTLQSSEKKQKTQINTLLDELSAGEKELQAAERTYLATREQLAACEQEVHSVRERHINAQFLSQERKAQAERLATEIQQLHDNLVAELGKALEELQGKQTAASAETFQHENEANERLLWLKKRLQALGEVNPLAMKSFSEMEERHLFIQKEQEDVLQAKNLLHETLEEIEKSVHSRFMKAFEAINNHFIRIFQQLFSSEDVCELRICTPQDLEGTDIDIIAQPKGKRPMHIEQLSSGEKAMTALALLMALYLYKPSPFCILDEVDAPLDDANTSKFNQLIRRLSAHAQFILITHNKFSMQNCDVLYGFTMPELGITRMLPVDLASLAHEPDANTKLQEN